MPKHFIWHLNQRVILHSAIFICGIVLTTAHINQGLHNFVHQRQYGVAPPNFRNSSASIIPVKKLISRVCVECAPLPALRCVHRPGGNNHFAPDEGTRPWLAPDEGTRTWDCRLRPPTDHHDYRSDNNYWPRSWVWDHLERYRAAQAPIITAGGSGTSRGSRALTIGDQGRNSTGAGDRISAVSSSADQCFGSVTVQGLRFAFSHPPGRRDACYSHITRGDVVVLRDWSRWVLALGYVCALVM